jgi:hypothetical protein
VLKDLETGRIPEAVSIACLNPSNARRDFNRLVRSMQYGAELYTCKVCLKDPLEKVSSMQDLPMFLPHELVGAIYNYGWATFSSVFLGGLPEGILRVWGHL